MYPKWRGISGILTLSASLLALGCGSTGNTFVRVINTSPGLTDYSVQVAQIGIASEIPYGTEGVQPKGSYSTIDASGNYRTVGPATNQNIAVLQGTKNTVLTKTTTTLVKNAQYSIVVEAAAPNIQLQVLADDNSAPQSGSYKLRFLNEATTVGNVDVYITPQGGVPSGTPVIGNAPFQAVSSYLQESPGTLEVQVTPTGNPANVLASANFSPASGKIYTVVFVDPNASQPPPNAGPTGFGVSIVNDPVNATASH